MRATRAHFLLLFATLLPSGCGSTASSSSEWQRSTLGLAAGPLLLSSQLVGLPGVVMGAVHLQYDEASGKIKRIPVAKEKILPSQSPLRFPEHAASSSRKCDMIHMIAVQCRCSS